MVITLKMLEEINASSILTTWFSDGNLDGKDISDVCAEAMKDNHFNYASWFLIRFLGRIDKIRYAVYAAELVIDKYEERYPNNTAPRAAIEAAKKVIENDTEKNREYARRASEWAYDVACFSCNNAANAAVNAASDTAHAAASEDNEAYAHASAVYSAIADSDTKSKIIEFGLSLIEEIQ
jgi:hypothetical protein